MTPRYSIPHATSCRISTRPHPPRYDMHTLPTQPPHPSHLTITRPLNARPHMTLYSTRTPQILRPRSSGRATSALRTFSTLAYARLSTPLTNNHTGLATPLIHLWQHHTPQTIIPPRTFAPHICTRLTTSLTHL
ncbi:hypothetical protein Pcinc_010600 [Petrolisthes cinctipes]|uniref:Uncharacterized protein n=1 Tax=Petrolisthes cinctipes TaxID=88211 RepID=A0AAE1G2B8_PETCI|nr:hypothetical protein Pcinc_010600 [Petrolisthes cinctipes]